MKNTNQTIKHELLNMMTIMSHLLSEEKISQKNQQHLLELAEHSTLLINHKDIFLNKKPQLYHQQLSVNELIETAFITAQKSQNSEKKLFLPTQKISLNLDRFYFSEALKQIFKKLLKKSNHVSIHYEPHSFRMSIHHESGVVLTDSLNMNPLSLLNRDKQEVGFLLGLKILEFSHIRVDEKDGQMLLTFPVENRILRNSTRKYIPHPSPSELTPFQTLGPISNEGD